MYFPSGLHWAQQTCPLSLVLTIAWGPEPSATDSTIDIGIEPDQTVNKSRCPSGEMLGCLITPSTLTILRGLEPSFSATYRSPLRAKRMRPSGKKLAPW